MSRATSINQIFRDCPLLVSLDLSRWNLSSVQTHNGFDGIFAGDGQTLRFIKWPKNINVPYYSFVYDGIGTPNNSPTDPYWEADTTWRDVTLSCKDSPCSIKPYTDGIPSVTETRLYGRPYSVTFNANGGTGTADTVKGGWPDNPGVTLASGSGFSRTGYRLLGWSEDANATSPTYSLSSSYTPTDDVTLYGVWVPAPTVSNDLLFPWMGGGEAGKVKVFGTVPSGGGIYALQAGDKIEVALMPKDSPGSTVPGVGTPAAADDVTLDTTSCSSTSCSWSATFPMSALSDADHIGQGMPYVFRARLVTGSNGNSDYVFSTGKSADVVAPAIEGAAFNKGARTVFGTVMSSGDTTKQDQRVKETKFSVMVTWPTGSSTASTTLTCNSGTADIPGATCPVSGSGDGTFTLPVPSGVLLKGDSQMQAKDSPAADEPTLVGTGEPNVSTAATFDTTLPVVTALPMTGGNASSEWWHRILLPALVAGMTAIVVGARRRRLAMKR